MISGRLLSLAAVGLGLVGTVVALVLAIGVWLAAGRVGGGVDRLAGSADRGVARASELLARIGGRVGAIGDRVREVPDRLADLGRRRDDSGEGLAIVSSRAGGLDAASRELEAWAARAEQASDRLGDASEGLAELPFLSGVAPESIGGLADRLEALAGELGEAVEKLDALHAALDAAARSATVPEATRRSVLQLSSAAADRLGAVAGRVEDAKGRFEAAQSGVDHVRRRARAWIRWTALSLTALLAWLGIGQASLLYLGWKSWGSRPPQPEGR